MTYIITNDQVYFSVTDADNFNSRIQDARKIKYFPCSAHSLEDIKEIYTNFMEATDFIIRNI